MVFGTSQQTDTERLRMYLLKEWLAQSKVAPHFDCPTVYMRQKIPACFPRICQSLHSRHKTTELTVKNIKARFQLPELTGDHFPLPVNMGRVDGCSFPLAELTGDHFPLPVNMGRVDGCSFPLAELKGRQHCPSTRLVETHARQQGPCWRVMEIVMVTRQLGPSTRVVETGLNSPPFMKHWDKKVSCEVLRTTAVLLELLCIRDG